MDPAMIGVISTLLGMVAAFIIFIFKQGKYQGTMDNRVGNLEKTLEKTEADNKCIQEKLSTTKEDGIEYAAIISTVSSRLTRIEEVLDGVVKTLAESMIFFQ
jgi:hypothetical protein